MEEFFGRVRELALLQRELDAVHTAKAQPGRCILLRGRRRVGKTRMVEAFCENSQVPFVFYTASLANPGIEIARFGQRVSESNLPNRAMFDGVSPADWYAALRLFALALPSDQPSILVIDEVPYLMTAPGFEAELQAVWDRELSAKPVLLVLIGSDLSMMEALNTYQRPFHQRGTPMVLNPLNPAEVGAMLRLSPPDAFDAHLITGGLPLVCEQWPRGVSWQNALGDMLPAPTSSLWVTAELSLAAEFPPDAHARTVLTAIGVGERTYSLIRRATAGLSDMALKRALDLLVAKQLVAIDQPISTAASKASNRKRYRVSDPYLRFWLAFLGTYQDEVDRGRSDITLGRIVKGWPSWRGRAIEPVVRESLLRLLPNESTPWLSIDDFRAIGGYWTRSNDVEVDLVGADRSSTAKRIAFVGSIKWHERAGFDRHDLNDLVVHRSRVPGAEPRTPLIAVSRVESAVPDADLALNAADLMGAWQV